MKFSNSVLSRGVRDLKKPETNIIWLALGCLVKKDLRDVNEEKRRTGGQDGGGSGSRGGLVDRTAGDLAPENIQI